MQLILRIDDWFIGNGQGTIGDRVWFYGFFVATGAVTATTLIGL